MAHIPYMQAQTWGGEPRVLGGLHPTLLWGLGFQSRKSAEKIVQRPMCKLNIVIQSGVIGELVLTTSVEKELCGTLQPVHVVDHRNHMSYFIRGIGHAPVPETGITDEETAFGRIGSHRGYHKASSGLGLRTDSPLTGGYEMSARPQFRTAIVDGDICQGNIDYQGGWRMRFRQGRPQMGGIRMQWLHLALRAIRVSVVETVVHAISQESMGYLNGEGIGDNISENKRSKRRWALLQMPFQPARASPLADRDQALGVGSHARVQNVQMVMTDRVAQNDKSLFPDCPYGEFQIGVSQLLCQAFGRRYQDFQLSALLLAPSYR